LGIAGPSRADKRSGANAVLTKLEEIYPDLDALYQDLHRTPELSLHEEKTAAKMAGRLRRLGFSVTTSVGGHGVVGVLQNGAGPTLLLRTDLDGLPLEEKTGLPYASQVTVPGARGASVPVMHACGHDLHMTAWVGTATLLAGAKDAWRGTLMMVGQPAEETGQGARAMLQDGLFTRIRKPDFALAIHDHAALAAGTFGFTPGPALANVDSVDITFFGKGGHGAYPHTAVDPIVLAARAIIAFQTIVSRETNPLDPAVITVGSFHGGTKHNIIPDNAHLQLTVRSYKEEVRKRLLAAIERVARGEAEGAGAPRPPEVKVTESTPATYNDPELTQRVTAALRARFGVAKVMELPPVMGAEDFSEYGRAGVPALLYWVGAVDPKKHAEAKANGTALPSLHSPLFAPDREATIRSAVESLATAAMEILGK
jgi:hippurate hydrolase